MSTNHRISAHPLPPPTKRIDNTDNEIETDPSRFFFSTFDMEQLGKIRRQHERLKIRKIAKFESETS